MNEEQQVTVTQERTYYHVQIYRSLYSSLDKDHMYVTPHKANGGLPEISFVHFWAMDQSHECIVSDEPISMKSIKNQIE